MALSVRVSAASHCLLQQHNLQWLQSPGTFRDCCKQAPLFPILIYEVKICSRGKGFCPWQSFPYFRTLPVLRCCSCLRQNGGSRGRGFEILGSILGSEEEAFFVCSVCKE
jgi:hypothetical protein